MQLSWFLEGESEINIQHNSFIMQISNALTQAHPTDTLSTTFFVNNGNHWAIFTCNQIALNSALFSPLVDMYQKRVMTQPQHQYSKTATYIVSNVNCVYIYIYLLKLK